MSYSILGQIAETSVIVVFSSLVSSLPLQSLLSEGKWFDYEIAGKISSWVKKCNQYIMSSAYLLGLEVDGGTMYLLFDRNFFCLVKLSYRN